MGKDQPHKIGSAPSTHDFTDQVNFGVRRLGIVIHVCPSMFKTNIARVIILYLTTEVAFYLTIGILLGPS